MSGEFRVARMRQVAAHLPSVVSFRDRAGFGVLVRKAERTGDLHALILLLAESADLGRLAEVTGCQVPERKPAASRRAA